MKRKFSFKLAPIKVPTASEEEHTMDGVDSPPFSPVSFIIERPHLSPETHAELKQSCATIVQELEPVDNHVYEAIAASHKIPRKWSDDVQAYKTVTHAQNSKAKTHHRTDSAPTLPPKPYIHIPINAATSFQATATTRKPSRATEVLDQTAFPTPPTTRPQPQALPDPSQDPLAHIRADIASRPKTSAAACIDYKTPSTRTSNSTSRSTTTNDTTNPINPHSTGLTSLAQTPHNSLPSSVAAAATAKAWMAQELARRRSEAEKAIQQRAQHAAGARPTARPSISDPGPRHDDDRGRSRANSFSQGIKDYIRPRAGSIDSVRSSTHSFSPATTNNSNTNKWWSGANLKRKGSWSSFRSSSLADRDASETSAGADGELDLNRALPALPGLETWREERRRPVHISQMMRAGAKREEEPSGTVAAKGVGAGGTFEERMRVAASDTGKVADPNLQDLHPLLRPTVSSRDGAAECEKSVRAVLRVESEKEKKLGLRKRLSRFWARGRGKSIPVGVAVVAN